MDEFLPLFPLNIVVFPGEKLNLHIFEPRYKQLIKDCHENESYFGIPTFLNEGVGIYGTKIKVLNIEKNYAGGEMDIKTKGVSIFKITDFKRELPGKLYAGGTVEDVENIADEDIIVKLQIKDYIQKLYDSLGLGNLYLQLADDFTSFDIGHHLGFTLEQEYDLLQHNSENQRQEIILQHLKTVVPVVVETERLKERVKLNGHFKNMIPPDF